MKPVNSERTASESDPGVSMPMAGVRCDAWRRGGS
jgi:hypothetical protein